MKKTIVCSAVVVAAVLFVTGCGAHAVTPSVVTPAPVVTSAPVAVIPADNATAAPSATPVVESTPTPSPEPTAVPAATPAPTPAASPKPGYNPATSMATCPSGYHVYTYTPSAGAPMFYCSPLTVTDGGAEYSGGGYTAGQIDG